MTGRDDVELELRRVAARLAALGPVRLTRPAAGDGLPPVDLVRPVLQDLADLAADVEGRPRRDVPELAAHALGDQLVVLVDDALAALMGTQDADDAIARVHASLVGLRRAL